MWCFRIIGGIRVKQTRMKNYKNDTSLCRIRSEFDPMFQNCYPDVSVSVYANEIFEDSDFGENGTKFEWQSTNELRWWGDYGEMFPT